MTRLKNNSTTKNWAVSVEKERIQICVRGFKLKGEGRLHIICVPVDSLTMINV